MWNLKKFRSYAAKRKWIADNSHRFQIVPVFINNGFGVEWRKLRRVY